MLSELCSNLRSHSFMFNPERNRTNSLLANLLVIKYQGLLRFYFNALYSSEESNIGVSCFLYALPFARHFVVSAELPTRLV